MTEHFEHRLSERLHAHPLPAELPDLGMRSMRLGQRMRRRRIGAVAAVLIVLVSIPGAAGWLSGSNADRPPVTGSPTASASATPTPTPTMEASLTLRGDGIAPFTFGSNQIDVDAVSVPGLETRKRASRASSARGPAVPGCRS